MRLHKLFSKSNFETSFKMIFVDTMNISLYTQSKKPRLAGKHLTRLAKNKKKRQGCCDIYTEKTIFPFSFTLNGIWSWRQFTFRFWTKWISIWFKIERFSNLSKSFVQNRKIQNRKLKGKLSPRSYPVQCERKWIQFFQCITTLLLGPPVFSRVGNRCRGRWIIHHYYASLCVDTF